MNVAADLTQLLGHLDSHAQLDLKAKWQQLEAEHRERERHWRREEIDHRQDQIEWRRVDDKRRRVDEKMTQVALLARLSALMGGFQVALYINQGLPSTDEMWPAKMQNGTVAALKEEDSVWSSILLNEWLLALWAVVSGTVIVLNFSVMVVASLIQLTVAHKTCKEDPDRHGLYGFHNPDGAIRHSTQFLQYWSHAHDRKFRRLMHVFSCGVPIYFFSLGLAAAIKFYMSVVAAFACLALSLGFIAGWTLYMMPRMQRLLLNRAAGHDDLLRAEFEPGALPPEDLGASAREETASRGAPLPETEEDGGGGEGGEGETGELEGAEGSEEHAGGGMWAHAEAGEERAGREEREAGGVGEGQVGLRARRGVGEEAAGEGGRWREGEGGEEREAAAARREGTMC